MPKSARLALFLLAVGCGGPDTLHYRLRDPLLVTVDVDGEPALPPPGDPAPAVSPRYDMRMRTGDDSLADASFTVERDSTGIYGKWDTNLPLTHGHVFEIVGQDGWVSELPTSAPARAWNDQVVFDLVPRLTFSSTRHSGGYVSSFGGVQDGGAHVITVSTPRSNLIAAEQRGDRARLWIGLAMLLPATVYSAGAAGSLTDKHAGARAVGGVFAAAGLALDVGAIYEIVRGTRKKTLHP